MKKTALAVMILFAISLMSGASPAFAKKDGNPLGWGKGEKKGWDGGELPPGLAKQDAKKLQKEAEQQKRKEERENAKRVKAGEKEAAKRAKAAEKEAAKTAKEAQRAARDAAKAAKRK